MDLTVQGAYRTSSYYRGNPETDSQAVYDQFDGPYYVIVNRFHYIHSSFVTVLHVTLALPCSHARTV